MNRYHEHLKSSRNRGVALAAAFATSATLLLALGSAFYSVPGEPVLADSMHARCNVARYDTLGEHVERQHCMQRLMAQARAPDAGTAQLAELAASRSGGGQ